jgi:lysine/arginine/ornithine transport system substrate-binding protein
MKLCRTIAAIAAAMVAACSGIAFAEDGVLRIGTEGAYPPFEYRDASGELKGFDIEIGNALCARMNVKCVWSPQDFDGLIPALKAGKIDLIISSLSATPNRGKAVDFSRPYYISPSQFVARKGSGITDDAKTLEGKVIAVQSGTNHEAYLEQKLPDVTAKSYNTIEEAELDLEAGRVDAFLADKVILYDWLRKEGAAKGFDFVGKPLSDPLATGQICIGLPKGDVALKSKIDAAIDQLLEDDAYDHIASSYFPFSIRP